MSDWIFDREFEKEISSVDAYGNLIHKIKGKTYYNPKLKRKVSIGKNPNYRGQQWFVNEESSNDYSHFKQKWFDNENEAIKELKKLIKRDLT